MKHTGGIARRDFLRMAAGTALVPFPAALGQGRSRLPNVVIIYADDLGYGDLSCYGATKVRTPNIDRLAAEGRRFTDAHSASAVCTPSRYCLLTGQYAWRIGNWAPIFLQHPLLIDTGRLTVPRLLRETGYATACIGKWHLGFGTEKWPDWNQALKPGPLELGFDTYFGVPVVNSDLTPEGRIRAGAPTEQLYNLAADLHQAKNVVRDYPDVAAQCRSDIVRYRQQGFTAPHGHGP